MNNIIYFDACAFVILAIFVAALLARRQVRDRANSLLLALIELAAAATVADFVAAYVENNPDMISCSRLIADVFNYLYFCFQNMIFPVYTLYIYATVDIWHVYKQSIKARIVWWTLLVLNAAVLLLNPFTHLAFEVTDAVVYVRKPFIAIFYFTSAAFAFWGLGVIFKYRNIIRRDKVQTLMLLYPIVISGIIIQTVFPEVLMEMLSIAVAVLFFMIVLQKHEYQIDPITGAMKYSTSLERITTIFKMHKPITVILVKVVNHNNLRLYLGQSLYNRFLHMITEALSDIAIKRNYPIDIFYFENGTYAILSDDYDINRALPVAEDVKTFMEKAMNVDEYSVLMDARVCIVRCPEDIEELPTMFSFVTTFHETMGETKDVMLYAEYRNDRNFMIRNEMDDILERAITENLFEMYYQPIYSTSEERFVGAEALIRLRDEKYGFIPPAVFIPMAENNGDIHAIGDFVLNAVFDFIARNDLDELGLRYIEINLSASQCIEVDLVDKIMHMIATKGIDAGKVSLEITETAADINPAIVDANVQKLHEQGIRFALDDYGTGYSNIRRVTTLPVDEVKLDKSFVCEIDNPQMWTVIRDTIAMMREMGKEVLVEGVETEEVAKRLKAINTDLLQGCELIQGFYFCRPLPEAEFIEFIRGRL